MPNAWDIYVRIGNKSNRYGMRKTTNILCSFYFAVRIYKRIFIFSVLKVPAPAKNKTVLGPSKCLTAKLEPPKSAAIFLDRNNYITYI